MQIKAASTETIAAARSEAAATKKEVTRLMFDMEEHLVTVDELHAKLERSERTNVVLSNRTDELDRECSSLKVHLAIANNFVQVGKDQCERLRWGLEVAERTAHEHVIVIEAQCVDLEIANHLLRVGSDQCERLRWALEEALHWSDERKQAAPLPVAGANMSESVPEAVPLPVAEANTDGNARLFAVALGATQAGHI